MRQGSGQDRLASTPLNRQATGAFASPDAGVPFFRVSVDLTAGGSHQRRAAIHTITKHQVNDLSKFSPGRAAAKLRRRTP